MVSALLGLVLLGDQAVHPDQMAHSTTHSAASLTAMTCYLVIWHSGDTWYMSSIVSASNNGK